MSNPTTHVSEFDGSAPGWTLVDPERYDSGLWAEEATTNLFPNPRATVNTTGASGVASTVVSRSTTVKYGSDTASFEAAFPGLGAGERVRFRLGSLSLTGSVRPYTNRFKVTGPSGNQIRYWTRLGYSDASSADTALTDVALPASGWLDIIVPTANTDASKTLSTIDVFIERITAGAWSINVTHVQYENKTYATSVAISDMGDGYGLSGSSSTRAASSASVPTAGIISPVAGAIAFRTTPTIETGLEEIWGECGVKGAATDHIQWGRDATKHPFVEWSANDAAYQRLTATETVDADTEHFFYFGHDGTATSLQVDAGTLQTGTRAAVSASFGAGELTLQASAGGVIVSPFATFDRLLTSAEIATLAPRQNWSLGTLNPATGLRFASFQLRPIGA